MITVSGIDARNVCLVTVTYGDRFSLLGRVLEAAFANGIGQAVVVDNGCPAPVEAQVQKLSPEIRDNTTIIHFPRNQGSAGGFHAGLKMALEELKVQYVWLLDDDNLPAPDALQQLLAGYGNLASRHSTSSLAALSLRSDRLYLHKVAQTGSVEQAYPPRSSFLGFHIKDLSSKLLKIFRKTRTGGGHPKRQTMDSIEVPFGPYGGLFFHTDVLVKIGYPIPEMYLYGDDTEFTCRLTSSGGRIFLIPGSKVEDIDQSWMQTAEGGNSFSRYLNAESDQRVYFSIRNQVFVERNYWTTNKAIYFLNRFTSLAILTVFAALKPKEKFARYKLILRAVHDGRHGIMDSPFA